MRKLRRGFKRLFVRNPDGSWGTQAGRKWVLFRSETDLDSLGFKNLGVRGLKPKHVLALVAKWKTEGLSVGTIKNRLAHIRWWAEKVGKPGVVASVNSSYGIPNRIFVTNENKARELQEGELAKVNDPYTRLSLRLQSEFGLRRAESIKIRPVEADKGNRLVLRASWTKGSRMREVPIRTTAQRALLEEAKAFVGAASLIPADKSYIEQLKRFEYYCRRAGIDHVHGHRHRYAQVRYKEQTGRDCPACGGKTAKQLSLLERCVDREVRLMISSELGHAREQITAVYLGR